MKPQCAWTVTTISAMLLFSGACSQPSVPPPVVSKTETETATITPMGARAPSSDGSKTSIPKLEDQLAQIMAAYRAGDQARLAAFAGERNVDLNNNTARVILEVDGSTGAHPVGSPTIEIVTLPDGRQVQIEHAPAISIRADLAQAIAATGAKYETASQNSVQVLAPFASLEQLTRIPEVRFVRLPYAAQR